MAPNLTMFFFVLKSNQAKVLCYSTLVEFKLQKIFFDVSKESAKSKVFMSSRLNFAKIEPPTTRNYFDAKYLKN